jgi:hypothetical protein
VVKTATLEGVTLSMQVGTYCNMRTLLLVPVVGSFGLLVFLGGYAVAIVTIADTCC